MVTFMTISHWVAAHSHSFQTRYCNKCPCMVKWCCQPRFISTMSWFPVGGPLEAKRTIHGSHNWSRGTMHLYSNTICHRWSRGPLTGTCGVTAPYFMYTDSISHNCTLHSFFHNLWCLIFIIFLDCWEVAICICDRISEKPASTHTSRHTFHHQMIAD